MIAEKEINMKKILSLVVMAAVIVSLLLGCGGGGDDGVKDDGNGAPMSLLPGKSNMMGYIDLAWIMDEMDIEGFYESVPKEPGDPQSFSEVLDILGIEELEEAYMFGDMSDITASSELLETEAGYLGLIAVGQFNQEQLIDALEIQAEEELVSDDYKGHTIYYDSSDEMALAFLSSETLVLGTPESVEDVIDVKEGDRSPIKGEVVDTYNDLGSGMVKMAMVIPEDAMEAMTEEDSEGFEMGLNLFSLFEDMETVGLVVDRSDDSLPIDVRICFSNKDSAENMKGMLALLIGMMDMEGMEMEEEDEAFLEIIEGMDVKLDGSCVEIGLEITSDIIEDMAESFEEGFMEGFEGFGFGG